MSKTNAFETDFLKLMLQAVAIANLADDAASSPATNLYFSLHTADPGEGGDQTTNECSYGAYARVAVVRTSSGFTVASGVGNPVANVDFPSASGGTQTATHFGIGKSASGSGYLMWSGPITPNIAVSVGVTARLTTATSIAED